MWNSEELNTMTANGENNQGRFLWNVLITFIPPIAVTVLYYNDLMLLETYQCIIFVYTFFSVIFPIIFKYSNTFQRNVIFLSCVNFPRFAEYNKPENYGLPGTRNLYLKTEDELYLGVWHILPEKLIKNDLLKEDEEGYFDKTLSYDFPVFVYMHGNSSNRAASHHIELHQVLRRNYHVITFDYRGYGDSTGLPFHENLVISDALTIMRWIKSLTTAPILVWGHSLGTGVATHTLRKLTEQNNCFVEGLVLESPFDNMRNEVSEHPLAFIFKHLPWFQYLIVDSIYNSGFKFSSDEHIKHVNCPILVLHAEDDWVIPFKLGFKLYNIAAKHRNDKQGPIEFKKFSKKYGYGHKFICRAPEIPHLVRNFVHQCLQK